MNFGTTRTFRALRPIETFGRGARGFNAYDGLIETAEFERIETHADAGVGVQISRPVTHLIVHGRIITHGGVGESLVKGVIKQLPAYGLSVQPGAVVGEVVIDRGRISTEGIPRRFPDALSGEALGKTSGNAFTATNHNCAVLMKVIHAHNYAHDAFMTLPPYTIVAIRKIKRCVAKIKMYMVNSALMRTAEEVNKLSAFFSCDTTLYLCLFTSCSGHGWMVPIKCAVTTKWYICRKLGQNECANQWGWVSTIIKCRLSLVRR